jgi:hypothetical protein
MGPDATIRSPDKRALVEIRDLDATTSREEVIDSAVRDCSISAEEVRILSIRRIYGGGQAAVMLVPAEMARKLCSIRRIRVGLVYCRAKEDENIKRCFSTGHEARRCTGPDREKKCRRCGKDGHYAVKCTVSMGEITVFRKILELESRGIQEERQKKIHIIHFYK